MTLSFGYMVLRWVGWELVLLLDLGGLFAIFSDMGERARVMLGLTLV